MNKKQLIARVQRYMGPGATRSSATAAVNAVLSSIAHAADAPQGIRISGFGTFAVKLKSSETQTTRRLIFRPARSQTSIKISNTKPANKD